MPGMDGEALVIRRRMKATREELFAEWTDAEGMANWMCPGDIMSVQVTVDLRVGGSLLIVMRDSRKTYEHRGQFTVIDPPAKLAFTWIADATDLQPTLLTVEFLIVSQTESELVLTHEKFPRREVRDRYKGGWGQIIARLDEYLQAKGRASK
jgi:uncharacterized protein YndB with AHSA1/START domain